MKRLQIWDGRKTRRFQERLLAWYRRHRRALPWRSDPSPYRVWVSEIMLQQTQVKTVLPYYKQFLSRFPDVRALAASSEEEVLAYWAGLGYYSRARNIRRAAIRIVQDFCGEFPDTLDGIRRLPGIGRYTAGAIYSIAFNQPQPVVDGNVRRIISRLHGLDGEVPRDFFWQQASAWIARDHPSDFNQAAMELGALVCTPSNPKCAGCPAASMCIARRLGIQRRIPAPREFRAAEEVSLAMLVLEHEDRVLLREGAPISFIPGRWGLPARLIGTREMPEKAARALWRTISVGRVRLQKQEVIRHPITYRRIVAHVFHARTADPSGPPEGSGYRWIRLHEVRRFLTSSLFRKALNG